MTQFKNTSKQETPQITKSGTPYTQEQLDLGMLYMQKRSFLKFINEHGPINYNKIDSPMFSMVASLINQGYITRSINNLLAFKKGF